MEAPPSKRFRQAPETDTFTAGQDFVSLADTANANGEAFGYNDDAIPSTNGQPFPTQEPRPDYRHPDRRHPIDRPKSSHQLPNHVPWILVKTNLGRRFVHNLHTKQSLWRVPRDVLAGVIAFEREEAEKGEKEANARWAEEQLKGMRERGNVEAQQGNPVAGEEDIDPARIRRRRSESLQREDEEAVMAAISVEAERAGEEEEQGARQALKTLEPQAGDVGEDSDGSYEYVEVTDDEGEGGGQAGGDISQTGALTYNTTDQQRSPPPQNTAPVEFGEDDIAWQLAALGDAHGLDPEEYDADSDSDLADQDASGLSLTDEDAAALFRDMLSEHQISPYTPWEKLITPPLLGEGTSILDDDRYTVLPSTRARKAVWEAWCRSRVAELQVERTQIKARSQDDPRIAYLAFLAEYASLKLYWPEFKRKHKREAVMNDRKLEEKVRERLYREHVARLKLSESERKSDLEALLRKVPVEELEDGRELPQGVMAHLHFISLPTKVRDEIVRALFQGLERKPGG